ncbi:MAG: hypothetical protein JWM31_2786 [Solirubrobacterales bacterium]|nr:hypothetical protein [Solirubrobacterales bacterium]
MRPRVVRVRTTGLALTIALLATATGCGGGDDGPSKKDYYASLNSFCSDVATAAARVSADTAAVERDTKAARSARLALITASLKRFADGTETALDTLAKAGAPEEFAAYQKGTATGFRRFVKTLRDTAAESEKDPAVLMKLQARLNAVRLPDPPRDVSANARACAEFSPAG